MSKRPALKAPKGTMMRTLKALFHYYPVMMSLALVLIIFNAIISAIPALFMGNIYTVLETAEGARKAGESVS